MTNVSKDAWIKWIKDHASRPVYDLHPEKVVKMCSGNMTAVTKFEKLAANKNIVVLSRDRLGKKCQTIFLLKNEDTQPNN